MKTGSLSNVAAQRNTSVKKNMKKNFVSNKKTSVFVPNHGPNMTAVMISEPAGLRLPCTFRGVFRGVSRPSDEARLV